MTTKIQAELPNGKTAEILIKDRHVYLNHRDTGFRLGNDGDIYTKHGSFAQKGQDVKKLLQLQGMIKWCVFGNWETNSFELVFYFEKVSFFLIIIKIIFLKTYGNFILYIFIYFLNTFWKFCFCFDLSYKIRRKVNIFMKKPL